MNSPDLTLPTSDSVVIHSNSELSSGDMVEARYKGTLVHRGQVTDIAPNHDLFWIMDYLNGGRRLLDIAELEIIRIPEPGI